MVAFISYAHGDAAEATELSAELAANGVATWQDLDHLTAGDQIPIKISDALDAANIYIVLASRRAFRSRWVRLELGAALARLAGDASFRIIPVVLDNCTLPAIIESFFCLDARIIPFKEIAQRISASIREVGSANAAGDLDWHDFLSAVEADQFGPDAPLGANGGWSKVYGPAYIPLAFGDQPLPHVSTFDSVSLTRWFVRGLRSLQRLVMESEDASRLLPRIERLLAAARAYLVRHFDGVGAGLIRQTSQGEQLRRDPRHSAAFVEALLALGYQSVEQLRAASTYALARFEVEGDRRLPTCGEILRLLRVVEGHPQLRSGEIAPNLADLRRYLETTIDERAYQLVGPRELIWLYGHSTQPHMSGYYTWWVLDACGDSLLRSSDEAISARASHVVSGLSSLAMLQSDSCIGFPLILGGASDLGATAQVGEVLLRLVGSKVMKDAERMERYVVGRLAGGFLRQYDHGYLLWSVPVFLERLRTVARCQKVAT